MNKFYISIISYLIAITFMGFGFYKLFVYKNPDDSYLEDSVNSYVGGDAYNYIINANYTTSYFVLALIFTVIGSTFLVIRYLEMNKDNNNKTSSTQSQQLNEES